MLKEFFVVAVKSYNSLLELDKDRSIVYPSGGSKYPDKLVDLWGERERIYICLQTCDATLAALRRVLRSSPSVLATAIVSPLRPSAGPEAVPLVTCTQGSSPLS
jgi:hypothetical protein